MKYLRAICLVSFGGLLEGRFGLAGPSSHLSYFWCGAFFFSALGWISTIAAESASSLKRTVRALMGGQKLPETNPEALAAEITALNAQLSQLRETATSFDMSFDQTLHRLNERLCRLEQQSAYVHLGQSGR